VLVADDNGVAEVEVPAVVADAAVFMAGLAPEEVAAPPLSHGFGGEAMAR